MNNKLSIHFLILIITSLCFGCQGPVKEEKKNNASASPVPLYERNENSVIIDTNESVVTWKGGMLMGSNSHTGYIYISKGELIIEKGQLTGGTVEVDMNTIEDETHGSDNGLINHLKDPDFFDVKKFPTSTIAITSAESTDGENIKVTGNLTIKGITNAVTFPAKIEVKDGIVKANGKLVIDRTKWGVRYKSGKFYFLLADQTMSDSIEFHIKIVAKPYKDSLTQTSLLNTEIFKEIKAGTIYQSSSPHHNVLHDFTYWVAMRDFCNKSLLQIRATDKVNKELAKELEKELVNAKAALTSSKFTGLKIESGLYENFLKQISDQFLQLSTNINKC